MLRFLVILGVGLLNIELCSLFLLPNKLIGCKLGSFFEVGLLRAGLCSLFSLQNEFKVVSYLTVSGYVY